MDNSEQPETNPNQQLFDNIEKAISFDLTLPQQIHNLVRTEPQMTNGRLRYIVAGSAIQFLTARKGSEDISFLITPSTTDPSGNCDMFGRRGGKVRRYKSNMGYDFQIEQCINKYTVFPGCQAITLHPALLLLQRLAGYENESPTDIDIQEAEKLFQFFTKLKESERNNWLEVLEFGKTLVHENRQEEVKFRLNNLLNGLNT